MSKLKGNVWVFGDDLDVDKDLIYYGMHPTWGRQGLMGRKLGVPLPGDEKWCMSGVDQEFYKKVQKGDFIVAGTNFGAGHDHYGPQIAMKACGIGAVIAESLNWNFFRNAIHIGVPVVTCPGIKQIVTEGDKLEVDLRSGVIQNLNTRKTITFKPLPDFLNDMLDAGGLMPQLKKKIEEGKIK